MTNTFYEFFPKLEKVLIDNGEGELYTSLKQDLYLLSIYTDKFVEYKFLSNIKKYLIATNQVTEFDVSAIQKWRLIKFKNSYGEWTERLYGKDFEEDTDELEYNDLRGFFWEKEIDNIKDNIIGVVNSDDCELIESDLKKIKAYLKNYKNDFRMSSIFDKDKLNETEKSVLKFFMYRKGMISFINQYTVFEDFFDKDKLVVPLKKCFLAIIENPTKETISLLNNWRFRIADLRSYLFGSTHNTKGVTGYSNKYPIFKGKIEYAYPELENGIKKINKQLEDELKEVFESMWLKSVLFDLLNSDKSLKVNMVLEKNEVLG